jgi:hypothetical protein
MFQKVLNARRKEIEFKHNTSIMQRRPSITIDNAEKDQNIENFEK